MQIYDLYHGLRKDRQYNERHAILQEMGFLPERDLISSTGAAHKFSEGFSQSSKDKIKNYFYSRNEMPVRKTV
jgi:hypothetical protein